MGQRNSWGSQRLQQKNIYNDPLEVCSLDPITGWYRDGYARTDNNDRGLHVVCATMTQEVRLSKNLILNSLKNCVFFFSFWITQKEWETICRHLDHGFLD